MLLLFLSANAFELKPFSRPHLPLHKYMHFLYCILVFARNLSGKGKRRLVAKSYSNIGKTSTKKDLQLEMKSRCYINFKNTHRAICLSKIPSEFTGYQSPAQGCKIELALKNCDDK